MRLLLIVFLFIQSVVFSQGTVVFYSGFQQGIPPSFSLLNLDNNIPNAQVAEYTQPWISVLDPENPLDTVAASTSYFETADTANRWLITPAISLGAFGNYVQWNTKSQDASYPDTYLVLVSTTDTQVQSFTDTIAYVIGENFEWTQREVNLTAQGYDGQTIYLAFILRTKDGYKLYVDDIEVRSLDNTHVPELDLPRLTLYPNPAHTMLYLHENLPSPYSITDVTGAIVYKGYDSHLNVAHFKAGMYTLHCPGFSPTRFIKW
ncbi:MAG: choice-of-anchor J domain-containing protein [Flavobacteriales bacterium]